MVAYEGEALAMLKAMNWVQELGLQSVRHLLSDSHVLIDVVRASSECASKFDVMVDNIRSILASNLNFEVKFIRR